MSDGKLVLEKFSDTRYCMKGIAGEKTYFFYTYSLFILIK